MSEISDDLLQAWMDGEAGVDAERVEAYVANHPEARARIEELAHASQVFESLLDDALGPVEPLDGLSAIRERIRQQEEGRFSVRLQAWWNDLWTFNRAAVVGVGLAAFAGMVAAPAVLWLLAEDTGYANEEIAGAEYYEDEGFEQVGVYLESTSVEDGTYKVIESADATLIWVDGEDSPEEDEEYYDDESMER